MRIIPPILLSLLLTACGGGSSSDTPAPPAEPMITYEVEVKRTAYGVPHIIADDWGSLGFGQAYAYAQDNYCVLMREVVFATGQSQRYFGDEEGDIASDFVFAWVGQDAKEVFYDQQPVRIQALMRGYVEGFNHYLSETGKSGLAEGDAGCKDAEWVRPITIDDLARQTRRVIVRASTDPLSSFIYAAKPPAAQVKVATVKKVDAQERKAQLERVRQKFAAADILPKPEQFGSNAYALGQSATQSGAGILLGNPHFPWQGGNRFYMQHLTMGNEYDVFGGSLHGSPVVNIGFNNNVAWSHTVSTGARFALFELTLDPENPLRYEFDGEMREITAETVTIDVQTGNGVEKQSHTFYRSEFGPIVDLGAVSSLVGGWPYALSANSAEPKVFAMTDINLNNNRSFDQWVKMGQASNTDELQSALDDIGIPWVNTIAVDRDGTAFYGDISAVVNISNAKRADCITGVVAPLLTENGLTTLDGSRASCSLGTDSDAPVEGIFGRLNLPSLTNTTYVANANDSYWLSNANNLLTGYSQTIGKENVEQTRRTRLAFLQIEQRLAGTDNLGVAGFNLTNLQNVFFGSRNLAAEHFNAAVVGDCQNVADWSVYSSSPADVATACALLANWDLRHNVNSVGAHIFIEFWKQLRASDVFEDMHTTPFDQADPVHTPVGLDLANAVVREAVRQALADGVQVLLDNNIALNKPFGEVQFAPRNGRNIPIHGGPGDVAFNVINPELVANEGYSNIVHGNSYMQTVTWDDPDCPRADVLLSYSQSTDPASAHYSDMTELYSQKKWLVAPYCEAAIDAAQIGETLMLELTVPE